MRKLTTITAAALGVAASLLLGSAGAQAAPAYPPGHHHAASGLAHARAMQLRRACSVGSQTWSHVFGPPASGTVNLNGNDSPHGCAKVWPSIETQSGHFYQGGQISNPGSSTARACTGCGDGNTRLLEFWRWKKYRLADGQWSKCSYRQELWPTEQNGWTKEYC